jgi:hypothetical protein
LGKLILHQILTKKPVDPSFDSFWTGISFSFFTRGTLLFIENIYTLDVAIQHATIYLVLNLFIFLTKFGIEF